MPLLQLGEVTLYAAALGLMEACIKKLTTVNAFQDEVRIYICYVETGIV